MGFFLEFAEEPLMERFNKAWVLAQKRASQRKKMAQSSSELLGSHSPATGKGDPKPETLNPKP